MPLLFSYHTLQHLHPQVLSTTGKTHHAKVTPDGHDISRGGDTAGAL